MSIKSKVPSIPAVLADVAYIDAPACAGAAAMSLSTFYLQVRAGTAPQPAIRHRRYTRWRVADIRAWLVDRPGQPLAESRGTSGHDQAHSARPREVAETVTEAAPDVPRRRHVAVPLSHAGTAQSTQKGASKDLAEQGELLSKSGD